MEVFMENNHMQENCVRRVAPGWRVARIAGLVVGGLCLAALFALLLGIVVQWLWNWLMPDIFGLKQISYWQAFGLLFLGRLLLGGFGHHGRGHHGKGKDLRYNHSERWKHYGHFWREKGDKAAEDLIEKADKKAST
jgi:hypothetical protein